MDLIIIIGLVVTVIVVVAIAACGLVCGDLMSFTATGNKTLKPASVSAGRVLVVYNPGVSGIAKDAAATVAGDLQSKGYTVNLAGIRSEAAGDLSGYDVVIVGGPLYFGKLSSLATSYLGALKPQKCTALGVFATTGSGQLNDNDITSLGKQVASLPFGSTLSRAVVTKTIRSGDAGNADCTELVAAVLR